MPELSGLRNNSVILLPESGQRKAASFFYYGKSDKGRCGTDIRNIVFEQCDRLVIYPFSHFTFGTERIRTLFLGRLGGRQSYGFGFRLRQCTDKIYSQVESTERTAEVEGNVRNVLPDFLFHGFGGACCGSGSLFQHGQPFPSQHECGGVA